MLRHFSLQQLRQVVCSEIDDIKFRNEYQFAQMVSKQMDGPTYGFITMKLSCTDYDLNDSSADSSKMHTYRKLRHPNTNPDVEETRKVMYCYQAIEIRIFRLLSSICNGCLSRA